MDIRTKEPQFFNLGPRELPAVLRVPDTSSGLIVFAHGSGSSHRSPRNNQVAQALTDAGFTTLLFDLLTASEERDRANVFDIELLASRLVEAVVEIGKDPRFANLKIGLFGASTGAGAALRAASIRPDLVSAVVSRGGRPDLAGPDVLRKVRAPTQLIIGGADEQVIELNRAAAQFLSCPHEIVIVPRAGHLFEEPGTLAQVVEHAEEWFRKYLGKSSEGHSTAVRLPFENRTQAGRMLAERLTHLRGSDPIILALPRGGVPVGFEIAQALDAELELLMVRKLLAPGYDELAMGAVVDGEQPQLVLNDELMEALAPTKEYIQEELNRQLAELERRRQAYLGNRRKPHLEGRTVIIVDDGIATGSTITAALRGARGNKPARIVLAVPVAPPDTMRSLSPLCDETVVLATPEPFHAVGLHYRDFHQVEDREVSALLEAARQHLKGTR